MTNTSQCDPDDMPICANCIGDDFLRDEIRTSGCTASCSVCGAEAISWGSRQYAQRIFFNFRISLCTCKHQIFFGNF
ncbi:hypothetical protein [Burkholderia catarinensis]|uniref:hypothetical protein n=1 Tax=Burkholderia catarinensis TaxID=1108140 RepID=UPI001008110D|nr:hypothetical protein [Burkholderia catarinensis]